MYLIEQTDALSITGSGILSKCRGGAETREAPVYQQIEIPLLIYRSAQGSSMCSPGQLFIDFVRAGQVVLPSSVEGDERMPALGPVQDENERSRN